MWVLTISDATQVLNLSFPSLQPLPEKNDSYLPVFSTLIVKLYSDTEKSNQHEKKKLWEAWKS